MSSTSQGTNRFRLRFHRTGLLFAILCSGLAVWAVKRSHNVPALSVSAVQELASRAPGGMVLVPGGDCWTGSDDPDADDDVRPKRRVMVPSFYMDIHEVTNGEFQKFDPKHTFMKGNENLPATSITYDRAEAYAKWAGKRLPTEVEWEKAARGTEGLRYPWGDTWEPKRVAQKVRKGSKDKMATVPDPTNRVCSLGPPRVRPVGSVPGGVSPYGCQDMAGNAWEWVQGFYNGNPDQRILRGGAVGYGERACRTYARAIEGSAAT